MNEVKKSWCDRRGYGQGEVETGAAFYHHSNNPKKSVSAEGGKKIKSLITEHFLEDQMSACLNM